MRHTIGSLMELEVQRLVAADEKAKAATGGTWPNLHFSKDEDEEIIEYIVEKQQFSRVGGEALFKEMAAENFSERRWWRGEVGGACNNASSCISKRI